MPTSILVLVLADTLILGALFLIVTPWTLYDAQTFLWYDGGWRNTLIVVLLIQVGLYFSNCYDTVRPQHLGDLTQQVCIALGEAFLLEAVIGYARSGLQLPRWMMISGSVLVLLVYPQWRRLYALMVQQAPPEKVLFLGWTPTVQRIAGCLTERPDLGMQPVGYLENSLAETNGVPRLGTVAELDTAFKRHRPNRIVVGLSINEEIPVQRLLHYRYSAFVHVEEAERLYERVFGRVAVADLEALRLLFSQEAAPKRLNLRLQRIYMPVLGALGLVLVSPVMLLVAIVVWVSSPGPALFRQTRVGKNGVRFTLLKFRSMYADAEAETGAVWAKPDDPRVTPVGKWLRQLRLDELPQLINVIRGEMSLVGPRPERPELADMLEQEIPFFSQRLCVMPGITGWAQINHKYGDTIEDTVAKLEYDLYYIKNLSVELDLYIIFHTLKVMLLSRGSQ
jgi:exopolysaccharide biosynthesis polyprenyl glycosylphosphotransferase